MSKNVGLHNKEAGNKEIIIIINMLLLNYCYWRVILKTQTGPITVIWQFMIIISDYFTLSSASENSILKIFRNSSFNSMSGQSILVIF